MSSRKKHLNKFIAFSICILGTIYTNASVAQSTSDRRALIIGISEYNFNPTPKPLSGVPHDIESATKIAISMGIPKENITYLKDSQATKANVLKTLSSFADQTSEGTRAFVYFSGHGTRNLDLNTNQCYEGLLTYEGQFITSKEFTNASRKLAKSADKVITLVDACHSQGVIRPVDASRSLVNASRFTAKFYSKNGQSISNCAPVNAAPSRGMLEDFSRIGGLKENFVQISSSRPDEVSWDEVGKGGMATQAVRDCLLGKARDTDKSGAVTMAEVQQCAQSLMDEKMAHEVARGNKPSQLTITGNRNVIPVMSKPPQQLPVTQTPVTQQATSEIVAPPPIPHVSSASTAIADASQALRPTPSTPSVTTSDTSKPIQVEAPPTIPPQIVQPSNEKPNQFLEQLEIAQPISEFNENPTAESAALSTLENIFAQRNPQRSIKVNISNQRLKIGQDQLKLTIESQRDGYVYLVLVGTDAQSFYILFPNGHDDQNFIRSGKPMKLPRFGWSMAANGPAGIDHVLVIVSDSPRKLTELSLTPQQKKNAYTYSLNTIFGRSDLINFFIGTGVDGKSESFGAQMIQLEEVK
jgi:hypothetical protein